MGQAERSALFFSPGRARCAHFPKWVEVPLRAAGDPPGQGGRGARASRAGMRPARPHCAQEEGEPHGSPSSCESPSPLSGRAARVKLGDAFHLPPNRHCDRQGIGCHPRGVQGRIVRPHGTRPERRLHGNNRLKPYIVSTPASRVRRKTKLPRRNRKSNFSTECGQICLRSRAPESLPRRG